MRNLERAPEVQEQTVRSVAVQDIRIRGREYCERSPKMPEIRSTSTLDDLPKYIERLNLINSEEDSRLRNISIEERIMRMEKC